MSSYNSPRTFADRKGRFADRNAIGNLNVKKLAIIGGSATIGAAQTFVLREYVDKTNGVIVPQLGRFGTASALAGIILGGISTLLGALNFFGMDRKISFVPHVGRDLQLALLGYGIPALTSAILTAQFTSVQAQPTAAPASRPNYVQVRPIVGQPAVKVSARPIPVQATPAQSVQRKRNLLTYNASRGVL